MILIFCSPELKHTVFFLYHDFWWLGRMMVGILTSVVFGETFQNVFKNHRGADCWICMQVSSLTLIKDLFIAWSNPWLHVEVTDFQDTLGYFLFNLCAINLINCNIKKISLLAFKSSGEQCGPWACCLCYFVLYFNFVNCCITHFCLICFLCLLLWSKMEYSVIESLAK